MPELSSLNAKKLPLFGKIVKFEFKSLILSLFI